MKKQKLIENVWKARVRFRPAVRRYDGRPGGAPLPLADREWIIGPEIKEGMMLYQVGVPYGFVLGFDQIREYVSDPSRGEHHGFLILKVQVNTGGNHLWVEPLTPDGNKAMTIAFLH
jgi:hypothetical protein